MRVFVTGADGFTGRYLMPLLTSAGHDAAALDCDLADDAGLRREIAAASPDVVVHLAGNAFAGNDTVGEFYAINALGTVRLLDAVTVAGRRDIRVIIASTAALYGSGTATILAETEPAKPGNHYANSKWVMERAVEIWRDRLEIVVTRPFNYTGVGQHEQFLVPKIVNHFRRRAPTLTLGNLDVTREFNDVRDVSAAYVGLVEAPAPASCVNIATGRGLTVRQIIAMAQDITGHIIEVTVNPQFVRQGEPEVLLGNNSQLLAAVPGWSGRPFADTLRWMLTYSHDGSRTDELANSI